MTVPWLTSVLCREVPGASVIDFEILGGSDGTSSRRQVVVRYNEAGTAAGLPTRLFTKSTPSFFSRMLLGLTDIAEGEATFYNHARPGLELRSPTSYYAGYDPRTHRSMAILEDLTERSWTFPNPLENLVSKSDAEDIVDTLAGYHAAFWDSPRFSHDLAALRRAEAWQQNLNRKVGFEKRTVAGFVRAEAVIPERLFARKSAFYPSFMASLALHAATPSTLLHQDVHLGNWLRDETGRMGLYDWQCVAVGHWGLDLSYALTCALTTDDRRNWEEMLLRRYAERLRDFGVASAPSEQEVWQGYRQQPLHALAFGTFTLGGSRLEPELQPRAWTLEAIGRIARAVDDLGTLDVLGS
jgi:thiamine kinase-like enzyme